MRALFVVLAVISATACSKKAEDKGPACPEVVDHMVVVMRAGLKGHESVNLGDRTQMIEQCEKRKMSAAERRCMATAKDLAALASCRPNKTPPPAAMPPAPAPGAPAPTAPTPAAPPPIPSPTPLPPTAGSGSGA
jgi:hypothetical protein